MLTLNAFSENTDSKEMGWNLPNQSDVWRLVQVLGASSALGVAVPAPWAAAENSCIPSIIQVLRESSRQRLYLLGQSNPWIGGYTREAHVLEGPAPGPIDRGSYILRSGAGGWTSREGIAEGNPQGNPTWIIGFGGRELAAFLGFRMLEDPGRMVVPGSTRVNRAIVELSHRGIEMSVHYRRSEGKLTEEQFLEDFERLGALPLDETGALGAHDWSYHFHVLFLPPEWVRQARRQTHAILQFSRALQSMGEPFNQIGQELIHLQVLTLDNALVNFSMRITRAMRESLPRRSIAPGVGVPGAEDSQLQAYRLIHDHFLHEGRSPRDAVARFVNSPAYRSRMTPEQQQKFDQAFELFEVGQTAASPGFGQGISFTQDELINQVMRRLNRIRQAVIRGR
jgi:hypothetical protein